MGEMFRLPPLWQTEEQAENIWEWEGRIRKHFGKEKEGEIRMDIGDMSFSLVYISDQENMKRFGPYCEGSPKGKYGVVWKAWCLEDRYVFDTCEYAVEFVVMSRRWEEGYDNEA